MRKCTITITALLEDNSCPTVVVDISPGGVSVNCPKSSGFEIEALDGHSQFDLFCKLPDTDEELHFHCKKAQTNHTSDDIEFTPTLESFMKADLSQNWEPTASH